MKEWSKSDDTRIFFIGDNGLIKRLIDDCINDLGGLPKVNGKGVEYSIFGTGSIALGTMTPWSDLEFGSLIQDDSKEVKTFFSKLTLLLHMKIIRFGESPLRMLGIKELNDFTKVDSVNSESDWFYDDLTKSGLSFDGPHSHACKTPLGRKGYDGHEDFELIGTVEELCKFQEEKWWKSDPHLAQALNHVAFIHGNELLLERYLEGLKVYADANKDYAFEMLYEDAKKFNPTYKLIRENAGGEIFNVKQEIYRFPDRMVVALGDSLGIDGETAWETIDNLVSQGYLTECGARDLKHALNVATELRLRTYSSNDSQNENMSVLRAYEMATDEEKEELISAVFHLENLEPLREYYYVVMCKSQNLI
jgi:hypothetical protein